MLGTDGSRHGPKTERWVGRREWTLVLHGEQNQRKRENLKGGLWVRLQKRGLNPSTLHLSQIHLRTLLLKHFSFFLCNCRQKIKTVFVYLF